jgi:hypothetical protein
MAKKSTLPNLIADAFAHSEATASDRKWKATRMGDYVGVEHHQTHMFNVTRGGVVEPVDPGRGSTSDRHGVRKTTRGFGCVGTDCGIGYRELYDDEPMDRLGSVQWRNAIQRDPELRATPPGRSVEMSLPSRVRTSPRPERSSIGATGEARIGEARRSRVIRGVIGDPIPVGGIRTRRPHSDPVIESAQREGYYGWDMNAQGPDYSQPDPFDFSDPEEARQAQSITDMEETLRGLDERSQRPRNEQ